MSAVFSQAVDTSIDQNTRVTLRVASPWDTYTEISAAYDDTDCATEQDGSLDVWGSREDGQEFRLLLVADAAEAE